MFKEIFITIFLFLQVLIKKNIASMTPLFQITISKSFDLYFIFVFSWSLIAAYAVNYAMTYNH